jgi:hypothetical protein
MMTNDHYLYACLFTRFVFLCNIDYNRIMTTTTTTTTSTSSNLPDKDQIRVHVRRDGSIERQRFNGRVWRQLCKYDGGEECQAFVAYRSLCVGHYHQTSGITVNESKRRQLIQQSAAAAASSKATTTMIPSKLRYC